MRGQLFIVAAPSGAGKSSLVNACLARTQGICLSISYTSRGPRPGERHAQHYHFVDKAEFERMVAAGDFFEHALVHGDYKGTARQSVEPQLAAAREEMSHYDEFDYVIVNEDFETAVTEMQAIFIGSRQRRHVQQQRHAALIQALLAER